MLVHISDVSMFLLDMSIWYYLILHFNIRSNKIATKIWVVFNARKCTSSDKSLNDVSAIITTQYHAANTKFRQMCGKVFDRAVVLSAIMTQPN